MLTNTQKIAVIVQICLSLSLFLWVLAYPFMGEYYRNRADLILIDNIRGDFSSMNALSPEEKVKFSENKVRFESLAPSIKADIIEQRANIERSMNSPFFDKFLSGLYRMLVKIPFFEQAWVFFAFVISLLCLKGREGAKQAALILPLIVLLHIYDIKDQRVQSLNPFPTEKDIVDNYLKRPLSDNLLSQKEELLYGFDLYLIQHWGKEIPSHDETEFKAQRDRGEYYFNLSEYQERAKLHFIAAPQSEHSLLLVLYLLWNSYFAILLMKREDGLLPHSLPLQT